MKILWCTIDRTMRVAPHIFNGLYEAILRTDNKVERIVRELPPKMIQGQYINHTMKRKEKQPKLIDIDYANTFDLILTDAYFAFFSDKWEKITAKKAILIEDQHRRSVKFFIREALLDNKFDIFLYRYKTATLKSFDVLKTKKSIWVPHSVDINMFKDYKEKKVINCLLVGNTNTAYPIRNEIAKNEKNNKLIKIIKRPSERL